VAASPPNADVAAPGETLIVALPALSAATNHNGGALHFGTDGTLFVGVGDNADSARAQNASDPFGKLLRLNADGSIPSDNPQATGHAGIARAVWALGLRNPFTFAIQPQTGRLHINDVGQNAWEEINLGTAGANYGWPNSEGPLGVAGGHTTPLFAYAHAQTHPARGLAASLPALRLRAALSIPPAGPSLRPTGAATTSPISSGVTSAGSTPTTLHRCSRVPRARRSICGSATTARCMY
jgi:glucose/arabinose dehydrogenase